MTFRIRQIDQTASGREIVRERVVAKDGLTMGRSSDNDIHVPDLAVELNHAKVTKAPGGHLRFEAVSTLGLKLDGRTVREAVTDARDAELVLGSYRISFSAGEGEETAVTIRRLEDREGGLRDAIQGFSLARALPGKRVLAWSLMLLIVAAFLAIPVWSHLTREKAEPRIDGRGTVLMDDAWSTGSLSAAHHGLEENCEACHVQPFVAVRDESCLTCHEGVGDHATQPRMSVARGPLDWGDGLQRSVADVFHKPAAGACTDCHTEHEGKDRMAPTPQKFCADCHGSLDARLKDTVLGNAGDFGTDHPEFKAALLTAPGQSSPQRISLADRPTEFNGLRFPHALHLDSRGGVARMALRLGPAKGYGSELQCSDCHRLTSDGVSFRPVEMERDCEACHSLVYDRVGATFRTLRHGDIDQMLADLSASDRSHRRPIISDRRRPGAFAPGNLYYSNFGSPRQSYALSPSQALSRDGVCGECHFPTLIEGRVSVQPVTQPQRYFNHGWFNHADHKQEECTTCHAAKESKSATDLLLPGIGQCRTCHLGESAKKAEVPSGCAMCHSFHPQQGLPTNAPRVAGKEP